LKTKHSLIFKAAKSLVRRSLGFIVAAAAASSAYPLELLTAYFQPSSSIFLSYKSVNSTFSRLFLAQANKLFE
jgi:hypothetical protein